MSTNNHALYETISHKTASAPYSLHYTQVPLGAEPALYLHWHNEMEFLLLLTGEVYFHIENKTFLLHAGDGIFIPPGLLHHATDCGNIPVSFRAFVLSPDILFSSFDVHGYQTYVLPVMHNNLSCATVLCDRIGWQRELLFTLRQLFAAEASDELYIRGLTFLMWNLLYRHHLSVVACENSLPALSAQLSGAIAYLQENYNKPLSLGELAALVPFSEAQFCRSFKRLTGVTPFRYLIRYRVLQSCTELSGTNKKITDIALSHGFNNISYYNRAFLQIMGMTPSEYRKTRK